MRKPVIGIAPRCSLDDKEDCFNNRYQLISLYTKKVYEANGIPVILAPDDGDIYDEELSLCDAFILPGGNVINKVYIRVIMHAIKYNKPLLGICLGMHALSVYSYVTDHLDDKFDIDKYFEQYKLLKEQNNGSLLYTLDTNSIHGSSYITTYDNLPNMMHDVKISKDSILYDIYGKENLHIYSIHKTSPKYIGKDFKVVGWASDGLDEVIEYNKEGYFILGIEFHPELQKDAIIFERLINEAKKRFN